ncbi:hypothetical protein PENVUL_c020G06499 [Penicillium vulpinum]|uniref:Uncharacterized protein n=1 Tax=Penicillium vulpinum TaxID=29845 RepID=A0A1V6RWE7_9EURO|nr:hypothetical protein PENVUL_c020G06499 [Penicillium vulpinum]
MTTSQTSSLWALALSSLPEKDQRIFKISSNSSPDTKKTLNDILSALESQRDRCMRDKWTTISIGGKELIIRDLCAKITAYVNKFMEVVDVAVQYDPVHAALPWAGVRFLLKLTFSGFEAFGAIVEGLEKATGLIARCGILEALFIQHGKGTTEGRLALEREMVKLYSIVLGFICAAKRHHDSSRMKRTFNLTSRVSIQESVKQMEAAEKTVLALKGLVDSERVGTIQDGISMMLLTVTSTAKDVENIQARLRATLIDLERPLVRIADQVSDLHGALKESERSELLTWLSPVRAQEHYRGALTSVLSGSGKWLFEDQRFMNWRDSSSSETFWLHGIPGCGKTKLAEIPFTIVIDALDECSSQQRRVLLEALEEIRQRCRDVVKIFVSSRHEEDIAVSFKKGEILEVTCQANNEDLKQFVETEVERFVKRWSTMHDESTAVLQKLGEDIKEALMTGAQGMFLWVTLQLESISDIEHVKDIDSIRRVLTSLPPSLAKSYEAIYRRIHSMGESTRRVAIQSFQWLLCAKRKLSVSEFVAAMGMPSSQSSHISARSIRDYCCNLVVIDNEADTLRLAHLTVREFFEKLPEFSINESNATVVDRCLGLYLADERNSDLLSYATWFWPAHVEQLSGSPQRAAIKPALLEFFTKEEHFEDWLDDIDALNIEEGPSWSTSLHRKLAASFASPPSALFVISCFGLEEVLESSGLTGTMDVNQRNKHDTSALYLCARWGHIEIIRRLLDLGAAVDAPGSQYGSALQAASFAGYKEIVKILLENGASFSLTETSLAKTGEYSSPLQAALANGHDDVAKLLIDKKCKLATQKQFDDTIDAASFRGNIDIVERLLSGKAGVFTPNIRPDPLQVALASGKVRQATRLIQEYGVAGINEEKGYFGNALTAAISSRKLCLVQLVVDAGANLDARGRFGSPLRAAVISNHLNIVGYLLEKGLDPNTEDEKLGDPLQAAASVGNVDMMLLLLDHGASVNGSGGHFGNTLQAACFNGHEQAVRLLIERGAALPGEFRKGRYRDALQAAVYAGHEDIVKVLFASGVKLDSGRPTSLYLCSLRSKFRRRIALPSSRTDTGRLDILKMLGPLEVAAQKGNISLVRILLAKGAEIDARDAYYRGNEYQWGCTYTALQIAAFWGHLPVVELILGHGADINAVRKALGTPLQAALEGGHFDIAEVLLSRGAKIDRHWGMLGSCLQVYSKRGHLDVVQFLLDRGAKIEDSGGKNGNALQVACDAGHIDIVRFLLGKRADVKAPGKHLGNALQAASARGHIEIVKLLLHQGIGVDDAANNTETALCLAAKNGQEQMVSFLLQQGANIDGNLALVEYDTSEESEQTSEIPSIQKFVAILTSEIPCVQKIVAIPLHLAAIGGHESTVSILLKNGANAHLQDKLRNQEMDHSRTLLSACFRGHASIAKRLFQHDPWSYASHDTFTPALEASLTGNKKDISAMLVQEAIYAGFKAEHFGGAFRYACAEGYTEFLKQILQHFDLQNWPTALLIAVKRGRGTVVEVLLQNGAGVDIRDENGNLALDLAIERIKESRRPDSPSSSRNWIEVLAILLCAGAHTKDQSRKIKEVFPDIANSARVDHLRMLDHCGYNIFGNVTLYSDALIEASADGDIEKIYYMGTKHVPSSRDIKAAVLTAIKHQGTRTNRISTIEALMSLRTPLLFDENQDAEPLLLACKEKYSNIVAILLQHARHGRNVVETALEEAICRDSVSCARAILELQGWEPAERLELCSRFIPKCLPGDSKDMLTYLFDQGVSPNTRDPKTGATLLYTAATEDDNLRVKTLVAHGADVNLEGGQYGTALHGAAVAGYWFMMGLLLSSGANVNAQNRHIGTPLMAVMVQTWNGDCLRAKGNKFCSLKCHRCCARVLLDWDADVDAKGGEFGTALQAAERVGNKPGIEMLLHEECIII